MRKTKERWFHVRGIATYETELFVQAATREEAEEVYLSNDNRDSGNLWRSGSWTSKSVSHRCRHVETRRREAPSRHRQRCRVATLQKATTWR